jgi:hypothetical protein
VKPRDERLGSGLNGRPESKSRGARRWVCIYFRVGKKSRHWFGDFCIKETQFRMRVGRWIGTERGGAERTTFEKRKAVGEFLHEFPLIFTNSAAQENG